MVGRMAVRICYGGECSCHGNCPICWMETWFGKDGQSFKRCRDWKQTVKASTILILKITALESTWYMRNQLLRDADWASMAHSLEVRVPLVDQELYKAVASLLSSSCPPTKLDMASAPQDPLPEEILHRKKTGFSIPVRDWLLRSNDPWARSRGLRGWALTIAKRTGAV